MLEQLQSFDQFLKHQLPDDVDPSEIFVPVGDLDVAASLNLYRVNQREGKYKVLLKFFEVSARLVGETRFREIAVAFIRTHPSPTYTLSAFHPEFPGFLAANAGDQKEIIFDLARFEWAWHRLGRADFEEPSLTLVEDLARLDPSKARFRVSPTVDVLRNEHRINDVFRSMKAQEPYDLREGRNFVLFWRPDPITKKRRFVKLWQAHFIKLLKKHVTLSQVIYNIQAHSKIEPETMIEFIRELVSDKVIVAVR